MDVNELEEIGGRLLVVFDGRCAFCNRSVRWLLARDRRDRLRFVPSESGKVAGLLARHGLGTLVDSSGAGTILVVRDPSGPAESVLVRSDAALATLRELPRPWPWVAAVLGWIPRALRDMGYRLMASWRYRIWGRLDACPLPTSEERTRFL